MAIYSQEERATVLSKEKFYIIMLKPNYILTEACFALIYTTVMTTITDTPKYGLQMNCFITSVLETILECPLQ